MDQTANYLSYESTGYFAKIIADYLSGSPDLQPYYQHAPSLKGITDAIEARKKFNTNRLLLVEALEDQYASLDLTDQVKQHIGLLANPDTFTVTTAHQPNIFTGPLYFIYKILHAIKLAEELRVAFPAYNFVPVYYMGSEDADLDELGFVNIGGQKLIWETKQTGAVGRMKVDKALLKLIDAIYGQLGVQTFGEELTGLFKQAYTEGKTIQQCTLALVNALFGEYGLVVLIPDNAGLKSVFHNVIEKELKEGFSHQAVAITIEALRKHYKVQAGGREINLFYLINDKRERIELRDGKYEVPSLKLSFTRDEVLQELKNYPERFSANVILRGAFQETVLPNIAFIGGGGELAYWLELKKVFEAVQIPYPVLLLRNSFLLLNRGQSAKLKKLGFSDAELFQDSFSLINTLVRRESANQLGLSKEIEEAKTYYARLRIITDAVDVSLSEHLLSLEKKALKKLTGLEKKILRAERFRYEVQQKQIRQLKLELFPSDSLQERVDNFAPYYARYGKSWISMIYRFSTGFNKGFAVVAEK